MTDMMVNIEQMHTREIIRHFYKVFPTATPRRDAK